MLSLLTDGGTAGFTSYHTISNPVSIQDPQLFAVYLRVRISEQGSVPPKLFEAPADHNLKNSIVLSHHQMNIPLSRLSILPNSI